jgi:hypothetical protein
LETPGWAATAIVSVVVSRRCGSSVNELAERLVDVVFDGLRTPPAEADRLMRS